MSVTRRKNTKPETFDDEPAAGKAPRPDEMAEDVLEFITAMDEYKRLHQRPFPTWSEVLGVLKSLGYARRTP